MILGENFIY